MGDLLLLEGLSTVKQNIIDLQALKEEHNYDNKPLPRNCDCCWTEWDPINGSIVTTRESVVYQLPIHFKTDRVTSIDPKLGIRLSLYLIHGLSIDRESLSPMDNAEEPKKSSM